jgi:hypothetical protein
VGNYVVSAEAAGIAVPAGFALTNRKIDTSTGLTSSPNPAIYGESVALTATVSISGAGAGTPTGIVSFMDGSALLGESPLDGSGVAWLAIGTLGGGTHVITATYQGDASFAVSASPVLTQTVSRQATQTALTSAPNPSNEGSSVTFTATVAGASANAVAEGSAMGGAGAYALARPTGEVLFLAGEVELGRGMLLDGAAVLTTTALAAGTHAVLARYTSDTNFATSDSPAIEQVVRALPVARNDAIGTRQAEGVVIHPLVNDLDPAEGGLQLMSFAQPAHGMVAVVPGANTLVYVPAPEFSGIDSFTYTIQDRNLNGDEGEVEIVVAPAANGGQKPQVGVVDNRVEDSLAFTGTHVALRLELPAGIYTGTLTSKDVFYLAFTQVTTPTGDIDVGIGGMRFSGIVFELDAYLNGTALEHFSFGQPITVTFAYDPVILGNLPEEQLSLYSWDGSQWTADGISIIGRDSLRHTFTIQLAHLTEFAFFNSVQLRLPLIISAPDALPDDRGDLPGSQSAPTSPPPPEPAPETTPLAPEAPSVPPDETEQPVENTVSIFLPAVGR